MGINFADEKVNVKSIPQFGSTRKILNPVEEEIKKSGLKIPKPEYERLSVENYMTKEEYKAFSSLSPSQQKRAFEVFKQSPEYKRFKKKLDAQTKIFSKDVTDSVTFFESNMDTAGSDNTRTDNKKRRSNSHEDAESRGYSLRTSDDNSMNISRQEALKTSTESAENAGKQAATAARTGAKTAAQTGAAAGTGGASEVAKAATEAVKKYSDTLKEAAAQSESEPADYETEHSSDIAISKSWKSLQNALEIAYMITIFGYSAPKSDVEAIAMLKKAWGSVDDRSLEEIEIVNIGDEESVIESWNEFIHTHHYSYHTSFFDTTLAKYPRRSCEATFDRFMNCYFLDGEKGFKPGMTSYDINQLTYKLICEEDKKQGTKKILDNPYIKHLDLF